jgi:protein-S-isoprenylcysteine O-methyltransferase Ste14
MRVLELKVPPPVVVAVTALLMWLGSRIAPVLAFEIPARKVVAMVLVAAGLMTGLSGVILFRRAKTTVNPLRPQSSSSLVTRGVYRVTRNPMYLGGLLILMGWAILLANAAALPFLPAFIFYITSFQIVPEERALTSLFGTEFLAYKSRVRRWL